MNYGHRLLDDPFFIPGNIACNVKNQNTNEILINKKKSRIKIECEEDGCDILFDTIEDYEMHYNSYHRLRCETCNRLFLSSYLLDLHMNENHGNYFSCESKRRSAVCKSAIAIKNFNFIMMTGVVCIF